MGNVTGRGVLITTGIGVEIVTGIVFVIFALILVPVVEIEFPELSLIKAKTVSVALVRVQFRDVIQGLVA